ncbi:MAG: SGNH/GDSL hydrolase family protein [Eubacteriales bacterium]
MEFFQKYTSNTSAGSGNQKVFRGDAGMQTGRIFYRVDCGGEYEYSFLFSNIIDSTFADGRESHTNYICDSWEIRQLRAGVCPGDFFGGKSVAEAQQMLDRACRMKSLTFGGRPCKTAAPGEFFAADPVLLDAGSGDYICMEISFCGSEIPFLAECNIPAYKKCGEKWSRSSEMPFPGMLGCHRPVKKRIAFLGDSITEGLGTPVDSYAHWGALAAKALGAEYAFWNLGLGYGRASDAASDGAWLYKAKQNDAVVVCFGVNDILQGRAAEELEADLSTIVRTLRRCGVSVLIQTIPPFDYQEDRKRVWLEVNRYIKTTLAQEADAVFDVVPVLSVGGDTPERALYGGHPNETGCRRWAEALLPTLSAWLRKI